MNMEEILFSIIVNAGEARGNAYEALKIAQKGEYNSAKEKLKEAEGGIGVAHGAQTDLIQKEINGEDIDMSLLSVHAQDHLMTTIAEKSLIEHMIGLYKRIEELEKRMEG
ncbi:PTS lactose/cellobiose transporter subunit IIA [Halonatronum saccharophilum]|uniref:PTS lactose/cellobiose transporter subunit IIA n=1 Tax=Halonatronum saccharophilum TaxID=150060 RepID=UPI000483D7C4|nr:PTS lactose/cellobiose transporter subunit IIA [Halonatronum saccharophilum]